MGHLDPLPHNPEAASKRQRRRGRAGPAGGDGSGSTPVGVLQRLPPGDGGLPDGGGLHDRSAAAAARSAATRQGLQLRPLKRRVAGLDLQVGYVHLDEPALASHDAGGARLLVEDDEHEGAAVVAVLLSPDGRVIAQRRTVVGGEA